MPQDETNAEPVAARREKEGGKEAESGSFICIPQIVSEIWKMLIGDNVLRGRYGLTCSQHNGIKDELIIATC